MRSLHVAAGHIAAEVAYGEVAAILESCDIDSIVLKGPHLSAEHYGDASLREYTDVDLLIRPSQFENALGAVIDAGYERISGPEGRYVRGVYSFQGWPVQLHRAFESYGMFRVDYDALFERAKPFQFGKESALGLSIEDLLLHLIIHAAKSHYREIQIKHVEDIEVVLREFDSWELFIERAREFRCSTASWIFLSAASSIRNAKVPGHVLDRLRPTWARRKWLDLWLKLDEYPIFRFRRLPIWIGRLVVLPGIVDNLRDGLSSGMRFAAVRAADVGKKVQR